MNKYLTKVKNGILLLPVLGMSAFAATTTGGQKAKQIVEDAGEVAQSAYSAVTLGIQVIGVLVFVLGAGLLYKQKQEQGGVLKGGSMMVAGILMVAAPIIVSWFQS